MLKPPHANQGLSWWRHLSSVRFWGLLIGLLVAVVFLGGVLLLAVERHDAFLRLRPLLCAEGMRDRQLVIVAMAAPLCALFTLLAVAELLSLLEDRLHDLPVRSLYAWLFAGLASALGALLLFSLRC